MDMTSRTFKLEFLIPTADIGGPLKLCVKTKLTMNCVKVPGLTATQAPRMSRSQNGLTTKDPFFERMMDERIATLRAFLRMTTEKYQVPEPCSPAEADGGNDDQRISTMNNVIELRRKR